MATLPDFKIHLNEEEGDSAIAAEACHMLKLINNYRTKLIPPYQSQFRVVAVIVYKNGQGDINHVCGTNSEPCMISGSICAERAALAALRHVPPPVTLLRLYVVSDQTHEALFPGILCKEFLSSMAGDDLRILVANAGTTDVRCLTLGALYPYASLYRHTDRNKLVVTGEAFIAKGMDIPQNGGPEEKLYREVLDSTARDDKDELHPIRYAAGVRFADGIQVVAWQKKGLEYGTTIDAVVQLAHAMEWRRGQGLPGPILLLQSDQFGILHAPSGHARGFLMEYDYGDLPLLVHETSSGKLLTLTVSETAPERPIINFESRTRKEGKVQ